MRYLFAIAASLALGGCFQDASKDGWGIAEQAASYPIAFRQWRVCKYSPTDHSLTECFQTGLEQIDSGYRLTNRPKSVPTTAFRLHAMSETMNLFNDAGSTFGITVAIHNRTSSGQAYMLVVPQCNKATFDVISEADRRYFTRTNGRCRFAAAAGLRDIERVMTTATSKGKGAEYYLLFEPGARVRLSDSVPPSDGTRNDGAPSDIERRAERWLGTASKKWFMNKYDKGSISSARLVRGDFFSGDAQVRVYYTINGGQTASAIFVLRNGEPRCVNYNDPTGCRPYP